MQKPTQSCHSLRIGQRGLGEQIKLGDEPERMVLWASRDEQEATTPILG